MFTNLHIENIHFQKFSLGLFRQGLHQQRFNCRGAIELKTIDFLDSIWILKVQKQQNLFLILIYFDLQKNYVPISFDLKSFVTVSNSNSLPMDNYAIEILLTFFLSPNSLRLKNAEKNKKYFGRISLFKNFLSNISV